MKIDWLEAGEYKYKKQSEVENFHEFIVDEDLPDLKDFSLPLEELIKEAITKMCTDEPFLRKQLIKEDRGKGDRNLSPEQVYEFDEYYRQTSFNTGIDWSKVNPNSKSVVRTIVKENCDFCREDKTYMLDDTYGHRKICKTCQNLPEPNAPFEVDESMWC